MPPPPADHIIIALVNESQVINNIPDMGSVSLFESEDLVKKLKPLDLNEAGKRSWIDQVLMLNTNPNTNTNTNAGFE